MKRSSSTTKPGCKGDPRMNRAVQVRLENPEMPLYHALRIGGFDFPANEDASTLDNDQVTLGQRKNQLLRRLRQLARKQEKEENEQARQHANEQTLNQAALAATSDTMIAGELYQQLQQQQHMQGIALPLQQHPQPQHPLTGPLQFQLPCPSSSQQHHHPHENHQVSGIKRQAPLLSDSTMPSDDAATGKRMVLQQHHLGSLQSRAQNQLDQTQNQQHTQGQLPSIFSSHHTMGNQFVLSTEMRTLYQPGGSPVHPHLPSVQQNSSEDQKSHHSDAIHLQTRAILGMGGRYLLAPDLDRPGTETETQFDLQQQQQQQQQPNSSTVTHPVPSSQQQQQQATASSSVPSYTAEELQAKETLALRVFQQELQTLYCRSMLTAGFSPNDTTQRSPYFRRFAFNAWKQECERLQSIVGDVEVEGISPTTSERQEPQQDPSNNS